MMAVFAARGVDAQSPIKLPAPVQTGGLFGRLVAMLGGEVVVAAPGIQTLYVHDAQSGALLRTLTYPSTAVSGFYAEMTTVGANVLIGDGTDNTAAFEAGAAYLIDGTTGALLHTFLDPTPGALEQFGSSVAALGGDVIIGAVSPTGVGIAYSFSVGGALLQTFTDPAPGTGTSAFGLAVSAVGSDVLVGARGFNIPGAAYLFDGATGALLLTFASPTSLPNDGFGATVAEFGGDVLIGAPGNNAVYLFDRTTGALLRTFTTSSGGNPAFGALLAVTGTTIVVGEANAQVVRVIDGTTGALLRTLPRPSNNGTITDLAANGSTFVVGEPGHLDFSPTFGAAWVFCGGSAGCGPCETCGPLGSCVLAPNPTCAVRASGPVKTSLSVSDRPGDAFDNFVWNGKWNLVPTSLGDLRNRVHTLCLFDQSGGPPSLIFRAAVPVELDCGGTPCWTTGSIAIGSAVFRFRDLERTPEGIERMLFRDFTTNRDVFDHLGSEVKIRVTGKGPHLSDRPLGLPALPLPTPLQLQLQDTDGLCWDSAFAPTNVRRNTATKFSATSD